MIVRAAIPAHFAWLCQRIGYYPTAQFKAIELVDDKGEIRGMVGYDHWAAASVWMHVAIDPTLGRGATRGLIRAAFEYPFVEAGREIVLGTVRGKNRAAHRLDLGLGFREVCRIADGVSVGDDLVIYEMRKSECRWIRPARKAA